MGVGGKRGHSVLHDTKFSCWVTAWVAGPFTRRRTCLKSRKFKGETKKFEFEVPMGSPHTDA